LSFIILSGLRYSLWIHLWLLHPSDSSEREIRSKLITPFISDVLEDLLTKIIACLVFLTILVSILGVNSVLGSTIRVTKQQAELIEWCTDEMLRVTDASMVQALNICAEYYLKL
jgi:hypothetical protein